METGDPSSNQNKCEGSSTKELLLEVRNLDVTVNSAKGEKILSSGISLQLPPGKIIPLVGPSGIGKSTFLRTIVRLHPAKKGCLFYRGTDIWEITPPLLRRSIGLHLQKPSFLPGDVELNLRDAFSFKHVKLKRPTNDDLLYVLKKVSLQPEILERDVHSLSGGEAQRVALARLLLLEPDVLLLDEPTSNLDEESSLLIAKSMKNWSKDTGGSAIWIVHEREVLKQIGEKEVVFTREGIDKGGQK